MITPTIKKCLLVCWASLDAVLVPLAVLPRSWRIVRWGEQFAHRGATMPPSHPNLGLDNDRAEQWWEWLLAKMRLTVPHRWFWHFYAYALPLSLTGAALVFFEVGATAALPAVMLSIQVARRLVEAIRFAKLRPHSRMTLMGYIFGMVYYTLASLTVYCASSHAQLSVVSLLLFTASTVWQTRLHGELAECARKAGPAPESRATPRGWSFERAVYPHFGAEVLVYCAVVMAAPCAMTWGMLATVVGNLVMAARAARDAQDLQHKAMMIPYLV
jgi:hypothetical protein